MEICGVMAAKRFDFLLFFTKINMYIDAALFGFFVWFSSPFKIPGWCPTNRMIAKLKNTILTQGTLLFKYQPLLLLVHAYTCTPTLAVQIATIPRYRLRCS